ncbi:hypothetical protein XCR1_810005 [Xenorhabdus cabanillasii JM26]|uniref:Uncharacterized protein n=1 Tax=Xenorhabdus cabanillasii JM26 TaxID=1427517 RepID=W1J887_9GAMM|nr:hypothetical protein XCR1_810005 [Xenorhabdus cabanillasii JM26]
MLLNDFITLPLVIKVMTIWLKMYSGPGQRKLPMRQVTLA